MQKREANNQLMKQHFVKSLEGDKKAYDQFFAMAEILILKYLHKRLPNKEDRMDVCQDTLLKIHAFRQSFDTSHDMPPWIFTIAKNALVDFMRKQKANNMTVPLDNVNPASFSYEETTADFELKEKLAEMPQKELKLITDIKVKGIPFDVLAKEKGIKMNALRTRASRAYKLLFETLEITAKAS